MHWFWIALIPPALWGINNFIDKYLVERFFKKTGAGALVVMSAAVGIVPIVLIPLAGVSVLSISPFHGALVMLSGSLWLFATIPYFYAFQNDEASVVVPLMQVLPIFQLLLGFFILGEVLTHSQLLGVLTITEGAIFISIDFSKSKNKFRLRAFLLMLLATFLWSLNFFGFKFIALEEPFFVTLFWESIGFIIVGVVLISFVPAYRKQLFDMFHAAPGPMMALNFVNEVMGLTAKIIFNFASLLVPIALVSAVVGFQPLVVFLYGIILTIFFPKIIKENLQLKFVAQKIFSIILIVLGSLLINNIL